ncbi:MAG: Rpn family recombination-promoting nuclease/putative transposase, partial [Firmicutes bacterium]|nr:Rpn family recombination-promoting nuclease/putative transposase [Bacillota bacterium]
ANREYKDSVFTKLFGEPDKMIELYNALSGSNLSRDTPIEIATLTRALFMERLNDLAFIIDGKLVILIEHQSTVNENMPLRLLLYIARIYEHIIEDKSIYRSTLIKLPRPEFYVLYNGTANFPDQRTLRLSDAFRDHPETMNRLNIDWPLELTVKVYNMNAEYNKNIISRSIHLHGYVQFVAKVREFMDSGLGLAEAIEAAIEYCISHGILAEFLDKNSREVRNMLFTEFDLETAKEVWREEALEEGLEKGLEKGREEKAIDIARKLLAEGLFPEQIAKVTELPMEQIMALQRTMTTNE